MEAKRLPNLADLQSDLGSEDLGLDGIDVRRIEE